MKSFDPARPVSLSNWPKGLKMPPLRRDAPKAKAEKPSKPSNPKPDPEAEQAPWWSCD